MNIRIHHMLLLIRRHSLPFIFFLVLTVGFTRPALWHLSEAVTGEQRGDTLQNYWNLWWTAEAILQLHQNPFNATNLHHPFGLGLYFHTYNFMNGLLSLPIQVCCGTTVAFNLMNMFALVLAGMGMYAFCLWILGRDDGALTPQERQAVAFLAGCVYAFNPYMAFHLKVGQPFMLSVEWFPFYLLFLLRGLHEQWRFLIAAGLVLIMIGLTDWHYTIYALLLTGVVGIYEAVRLRERHHLWSLVRSLALVGGIFAIGMLPVLVPMLQNLAAGNNAVRDIRHSIYHSTDLLAYLFPSIFHPVWGDWAESIFHGWLVERFITGGVVSLGMVPLALAVCGMIGERPRSTLFTMVFVVFVILSLGPYLRVAGYQSAETEYPIPLPYLLFRQLPFMDIHRIPSRFASVVMLALAILVAFGSRWLLTRQRVRHWSERQRLRMVGVLLLLVAFEFVPRPFGMVATGASEVSEFYRQIAAEPERFAVLEIPDLDYLSMFYQTHHRQPIVGGNISRPEGHPWRRARLLGSPIRVVRLWDDMGVEESAAATRSALRCQGIRYVVVYSEELGEATRSRIRAVEAELFGEKIPIYEDDYLRAYDVTLERPHEPYWTPNPNEWYEPEYDGAQGTVGRWMVDGIGTLQIYPCGQERVRMRFDITAFGNERTLMIQADGQALGRMAVTPGVVRRVQLMMPMRAEEHRVVLQSLEPPISPAEQGVGDDVRPMSLFVSRVEMVEPMRPAEDRSGDND